MHREALSSRSNSLQLRLARNPGFEVADGVGVSTAGCSVSIITGSVIGMCELVGVPVWVGTAGEGPPELIAIIIISKIRIAAINARPAKTKFLLLVLLVPDIGKGDGEGDLGGEAGVIDVVAENLKTVEPSCSISPGCNSC